MKKATSILLLMSIMIIALTACGMSKPKIEDYEWRMRMIMHIEDNQVVYDAVEEESDTHPIAKDGKITITDVTNGKTYEGTYIVSGRNPEGTDYHITIDGKSGYAGVAMTTYAAGSEEPTLPITLDGYSMFSTLNPNNKYAQINKNPKR